MGHKQQKEKPLSDVEDYKDYKDYRRVSLQAINYSLLHLLAPDSLLINHVNFQKEKMSFQFRTISALGVLKE